MKLLKWLIPLFVVIIVAWYVTDFIRYSDYDERKQVSEVNKDTLVLLEIKIKPDASYKLLEVKIISQTRITGLSFRTLFVNHIDDLKHGDKVRVWYYTNAENENIAEIVVAYNLFNFH